MERFLLLEKSSPRIVLNSPGDRRKSPFPGLSHFWLYPHLLTNDHTNSDPPSIDGELQIYGIWYDDIWCIIKIQPIGYIVTTGI